MPDEKEDGGDRVTIGGFCLETKNGGITHCHPIVQYANGTREGVQELWHFIAGNAAIQSAMAAYAAVVTKELIGWGDRRVVQPVKTQ